MTKEKLQKLGLSEKEASVYLAMLELGPSVVSNIAKKASVNRSTVYVVLDFLTKRGLVNESDSKTAKLYNAAPPEKLIDYLENLSNKYKDLSKVAKELLPELKSVHKVKKEKEESATPKIYFVEGYKNIQNVYEDTLSSLESIRAYASAGEAKKADDPKINVIMPNSRGARTEIARSKEEARAALSAPKSKYAFAPEINIYDDKIIFISQAENFALVVESKELARTLKRSFDLAEKEIARTAKESSSLKTSLKTQPG